MGREPWFEAARFEGDRVREFAARWISLPSHVRDALIQLRAYEEEGAYQATVLADPVRGFFRQLGGSEAVADGEYAASSNSQEHPHG